MASQYKVFTAGSVLTATEVQSYLMKQAVIACDATTDYPSSPVEGMTVYDKGLDTLLVYTGSNWRQPWSMPWGVVKGTAGGTSLYGFVRYTSNQTITGNTTADLTNATLTFTAVANRLYKITGMADFTHTASSTVGSLLVNLDGTTIGVQTIAITTPVAGGANDRMAIINQVTTLTAGSHTIKLQATTPTSPGNLTVGGSTVVPTIFVVEDIGPAGVPA